MPALSAETKLLSVFARISPKTDAPFTSLLNKYATRNEDGTTSPWRTLAAIPLVRAYIASEFSQKTLDKTLSILASKNTPFPADFRKAFLSSPVPLGVHRVKLDIGSRELTKVARQLLLNTGAVKRIMSSNLAKAEAVDGFGSFKVVVTPALEDKTRAEEILREIRSAVPEGEAVFKGMEIDGLLLGDETLYHDGQEMQFFPFAATEAKVVRSEKRPHKTQLHAAAEAARNRIDRKAQRRRAKSPKGKTES